MSESRGISLPSEPAKTPGLPESFQPIAFEKFETLNTKPSRAAIADGEMYWCDGFMPVAPSTLRTLWGVGPDVFSAQGANNVIVWFQYGNIADQAYGFVLQSDGALWAYNTTTLATTPVLAPGTVGNPRTVFGFTSWGSQYVLFANDQTNGYWLWNGTSTFAAGTLSPFVEVTNSGKGYTSAPTITVQTTGSGAGATFTSQLDGDSLSLITVVDPGSGFAKGDFAILSFSGGGSDDQAIAAANLSAGGGVTSIVVTNGGSGYTFSTSIAATGGGGTGASFIPNIMNGSIASVTVLNPGSGYTSPPTLVANDPGYGSGSNHINGGTGAAGYAVVGSNGIASATMIDGGTGYTSVPKVEIVGDGAGALAVAHISGGVVTDIAVTNPGQGYTDALMKIIGGNDAANADITLMPFGISGTTLEVYQSRVWLANGGAVASFPPKNRVLFTAAQSPVDFGNGGGAFLATDSFVRVGYHWLKQTNGFLFLGGDSSINYISGVQTGPVSTSVPVPTTTFGNQNVDPQLGSPWASSVQVFSRNINFANTIGIFVSYGGAVSKVSAPLDGFYNTGNIGGVSADFSSAVANIFGVPVYMLLLPVVDKFTGLSVNKLLMWDGRRFFTSQQDKLLGYIASQEFNSALTAWGTDGLTIFQLFARPSIGFRKVAQSKLFSAPAYWTTKTATRLHVVARPNVVDEDLLITIDNEKGQGTGAAQQVVKFAGSQQVEVLGPYPIGQIGRMIGVTVSTNASDTELLSVGLAEQLYSTNI